MSTVLILGGVPALAALVAFLLMERPGWWGGAAVVALLAVGAVVPVALFLAGLAAAKIGIRRDMFGRLIGPGGLAQRPLSGGGNGRKKADQPSDHGKSGHSVRAASGLVFAQPALTLCCCLYKPRPLVLGQD